MPLGHAIDGVAYCVPCAPLALVSILGLDPEEFGSWEDDYDEGEGDCDQELLERVQYQMRHDATLAAVKVKALRTAGVCADCGAELTP